MASRHCTRGSPASSMTENWRVKMATSALDTLRRKEKSVCFSFFSWIEIGRDLLAAQYGSQCLRVWPRISRR